MVEVYSSQNKVLVYLLKSFLESENIPCEITNASLDGIAGGIPVNETWPKLTVLDDDQAPSAEALIKEYLADFKADSLPSFCPSCDSEEIIPFEKGTSFQFPKFKCGKCGHIWNQ